MVARTGLHCSANATFDLGDLATRGGTTAHHVLDVHQVKSPSAQVAGVGSPVGAGVPHHDLAFPIWRGSRRASLLI
ncbi:hypothetical protein ACFFX0_25775 [Citricoccus parietis]|uniref:Uncharacterized protein n=1 Tax=Citricoccus parietis TaxID=592307 RepID=A0ABV5G7L3_9MICC